MKKKIYIAAGALILIIAIFAYSSVAYLNFQVNKSNVLPQMDSYDFTVETGLTVREVIADLEELGFIDNSFALEMYIRLHPEVSENIQAGKYDLGGNLSALEVLDRLSGGTFDQIELVFIEGWRVEEFAQYLAVEMGNEFATEFLTLTEGYEGKIFPDTYFLDENTTPQLLVDAMLENYEQKIMLVLSSTGNLNASDDFINQRLILASLIEREVATELDRALVSGILLKRLNSGWVLGVDAGVQYALANEDAQENGRLESVLDQEFDWWPKVIYEAELQIDSPYNIRENAGLPPGPIANPGYDSLLAAFSPMDSEYWYYLTDSDGINRYGTSLAEHNYNIATFGTSQ